MKYFERDLFRSIRYTQDCSAMQYMAFVHLLVASSALAAEQTYLAYSTTQNHREQHEVMLVRVLQLNSTSVEHTVTA